MAKMTTLLFLTTLLLVVAADAAATSLRSRESPELLAETVLNEFKARQGLRADSNLFLQTISNESIIQVATGDDQLQSVTINRDEWTPYSVLSDRLTTVMLDGQALPVSEAVGSHKKMYVGNDDMNEDLSFLAITNEEQTIQQIFFQSDSTLVEITKVKDTNVYATITRNDYDSSHSYNSHSDLFHKKIRNLQKIPPKEDNDRESSNSRALYSGCTAFRTIEIAVAFDYTFCNVQGPTASINEIINIVAVASTSWYRRVNLCVDLKIVHMEGFCALASDPYRVHEPLPCLTSNGMKRKFRDYWEEYRQDVVRDVAHLFRSDGFVDGNGDNSDVAGCAKTASLCSNQAYAVNDLQFTNQFELKALVFAHELGHNAGAPHIDSTTSGDYIMEGGSVLLGLSGFSAESKTNIRNHIDSVSCIGTVGFATLPPGGTVLQGLYRVQQKSTNRYLDAYRKSGNDYSAVTRLFQDNDTQKWRFTPIGFVATVQYTPNDLFMDAYSSSNDQSVVNRAEQFDASQQWAFLWGQGWDPGYRIQQLSTGRYLDAYTSSNDYNVVTRNKQYNDSQRWKLTQKATNVWTIQQRSTERYLDAYMAPQNDYKVVTRPSQSDGSQDWRINAIGVVYTIQQEYNDRYLDAYTNAYTAMTRTWQNDDTQRWVAIHDPADDNVYVMRQLETLRYLSAHTDGGNDFEAYTQEWQDPTGGGGGISFGVEETSAQSSSTGDDYRWIIQQPFDQ